MKRILVVPLLALGAGIAWSAQVGESRGSMAKKTDAIFAAVTSPDAPGLAVLAKKDGKIVFEHGYGVRDLQSRAKIDARTDFRLASCTKQFTAMAIMLLAHDVKLRHEETLTQIFPEFPAYGKTITIRNLLNHTSGLPDYEDLMDAEKKAKGLIWSPKKQIQDEEVLKLLENARQGKFAPGTRWEYSNSAYVVLGLIVAKVSGMPFREFLRQRIFLPLHMDHTLVFQEGINEIPNRAFGHSKVGKHFERNDQSSTSATLGDGGIYSNLDDLSKWDDALRRHTLLSERDFQAALTPPRLPPGAESRIAEEVPESMRGHALGYGFGWFLDLRAAHPLMWHYGETMGFKTAIQRFTKDKLTIIVLCNRTDLDPSGLALQIANLYFDSPEKTSTR